MNRVVVAELLDTDSGTPQEVRDSLADLRWLNRNFGGITTTADLLDRVAKRAGLRELTYLDVAGATGDVSNGVQQRLARKGIKVEHTVLDRSFTHLNPDTGNSVVADAFQLPFRDGTFDVVGSALFLHHFEPAQIASFIRESLRVCKRACIINDLHRGFFHLLAAQAGRLLYRSRITSHDAPASVRRAYTATELRQILAEVQVESQDFTDHFLCRMGVILWKLSE